MGVHIWCLIAPMFLVSVKAGLHQNVAQSFYETPQSSSPVPTSTQQGVRPDLIGMKEVVLFLTPEQVAILQAAGAVVQPYPEYENDYAELHEKLRQSIEQQTEQQYQAWRGSSEDQSTTTERTNYYKLLNIQEINDDLAHQQQQMQMQTTEATTEKITTTTTRYKYNRTKARQQYKGKENAPSYVPKKSSRIKVSNQNEKTEYVRYLPSYEMENLQMIPFKPLPISPYQIDQIQGNVYIHSNGEIQPTEFVQMQNTAANTDPQHDLYSQTNLAVQQNADIQINNEAQTTTYTVGNTEAQPNTYSQETTAGQQNVNIVVNKEVSPTAYTVSNTEAQPTAYTVANTEAQSNANSQKTITSLNGQVNTEAQQIAHFVANTEIQPNAYSHKNIAGQLNSNSQVNTEAQHIAYLVAGQQNTNSQVKTEAQQIADFVANTEAQRQNAFSQNNNEAQLNVFAVANTGAQQNAYLENNTDALRNILAQIHRDRQRYLFKLSEPARAPLGEVSEIPQVTVEVPVATQQPATAQPFLITQDTNTQFQETLSTIEGLPPLPPLPTSFEVQQEKPDTPVLPRPTAATPTIHHDQLSLLLAPLYQHQTIESITQQKEELLQNEFRIRSKLQQMKDSQNYDHQEYTTEIEKLTRNFGEQNALAKIEATSASNSPSVFVNQGSETTESQTIKFVKNTELPVLVRIPKPHEVKIPAPYPMPIRFMRPYRLPKPTDAGKHGPPKGMRNLYVKIDNPYTIQRSVPVPFTNSNPIASRTPSIGTEQLAVLRHIWEH